MKIRLLALLAWLFAIAPVTQSAPVVTSIDSIGITVNDLDRALDFYTNVLGFEVAGHDELSGDAPERLYGVFEPADSRSNDRWFQHIAIIVSDMDRAYRHLRSHKVAHASSGPQLLPAWNPNAGGIEAFYFKDPDGNHLEVLHFPPGKGDERWQHSGDRLFLGIDHTAIVVADTDQSVRFYRDSLGLQIAGTSENYGIEQERLNGVFGARLRITALRAERGPGVELLEYLAPRTGRPMPVDTQSNDDWHWQVNASADVAGADRAIRERRYRYVSPGAVALPGSVGLHVRDPDGHAVMLLSPTPAHE